MTGPLLFILVFNSICFSSNGIKFNSETVIDLPSVLSDGKHHLHSLEAKTKTPIYGDCWATAVSHIKKGCRYLTEEIQSALALRLTDCFLQASGHGPILCDTPRQECLKELSDRAFNAYTEFYTHTQSICYFLQSKIWHEETERTIDKLSHTSQRVTSQLAEAEKSQASLLEQQNLSLNLQQNLASHLSASKETITKLMNELKVTAEEQKAGLVTLFEQLSALQAWVIGEVSWIDSLLFYSCSAFIAFLLTSTPRTLSARIILFSILSFNYVVERVLSSQKSGDAISPIFDIGNDIDYWIWFIRRTTISTCAAALVAFYLKFKDYNSLNNKLLRDIKIQNEELKLLLIQQKASRDPPLADGVKDNVLTTLPFVAVGPFQVPQRDLLYSSIPDNGGYYSFNKVIHSQEAVHKCRSNEVHKQYCDVDMESIASTNSASEGTERSVRRSLRIKK